ncbi:MAG: helix-turn-helix domain-containing protein [Nitriliruptorales bacterium]|nr:helix-turn-helix domain-containing protein [Nitriliruptorales bacterium]
MSRYEEFAPHAALAEHVACTWVGAIDDHVGYTDRVLPDGCLDIVWDGVRLQVAGPDTGPVPIAPRPGLTFVGIRFRPGRAPVHLGLSAAELVDLRVSLADLWGAGPAGALAERLVAATTAEAATHIHERALLERLPDAQPADPLVATVVDTLTRGSAGAGIVATLARRLDVSERHLHRRCTAAVGYGPKTLDRILRFRRALGMAGHAAGDRLGLAALAAHAGYADQAHLTRECGRLAGLHPSDLFKTRS